MDKQQYAVAVSDIYMRVCTSSSNAFFMQVALPDDVDDVGDVGDVGGDDDDDDVGDVGDAGDDDDDDGTF